MNFPKRARVRKRSEYLRFFHQSDVKRLDSCVVFRLSNSLNEPRIGITVKAKTTSVLRNKIKRQIREAFRHHRTHLKAFDYNVVVTNPVQANFRTPGRVRKSLEAIWSNEVSF